MQVVLSRRDAQNVFQPVFAALVDPAASNSAPRAPLGKVWTVFENGPATEKLDLLMLGEGYAEKDLPKFHADVKKLVDLLFSYEPFKSRRGDFNVRALDLPSAESGVYRHDSKIFRRTPLSVQYGIFGSERYVLTYDDRALREAAAAAPYDFLEILVNDARYGGGGIFNHQATAAVDSSWAEYLFVHEFGHHFGGLADEYYTSDVAYETGGEKPEPWEPNVTAQPAREKLKWADLVEAGTPLPTPWEKERFETRSREIQKTRRAIVARRQAAFGPRRAVPRRGEGGDGAPRLHEVVRQGRRVRGGRLRGEGPLPLLGRLHHVHAGQRGLLPRLPARDHAGDRAVRAPVGRALQTQPILSRSAVTCATWWRPCQA